MRRRSRVLITLISAFTVGACVRTTPQPAPEPPAPPPPAVVVPDGCLADLSGEWLHADDRSWKYVAQDDGGTLALTVQHRVVVDAGFVPRTFRQRPDGGVDAGSANSASADAGEEVVPTTLVIIQRTDAGFVGVTSARLSHPSGKWCDVTFPTRVTACVDGGLELETLEAVALGESCQPPAQPGPPLVRTHHLIRSNFAPSQSP